jgi:hypothetical protein
MVGAVHSVVQPAGDLMSRHVTHPWVRRIARVITGHWVTVAVLVPFIHWWATGATPKTPLGVAGLVLAGWGAGMLSMKTLVRRHVERALDIAATTVAGLEADLKASRVEFVALHAAYLSASGKRFTPAPNPAPAIPSSVPDDTDPTAEEATR